MLVTFKCRDGDRRVEGRLGESLMRIAVRNDIEGVIGECGGEMSCGTCHVYVPEEWLSRLPGPSLAESEILEVIEEVAPQSRLACQLELTEELDGITVTVPNPQ
jgi:ferredoxin